LIIFSHPEDFLVDAADGYWRPVVHVRGCSKPEPAGWTAWWSLWQYAAPSGQILSSRRRSDRGAVMADITSSSLNPERRDRS
jgi:hypothetical protein